MKLDQYGNEISWIPKLKTRDDMPLYQALVQAIQDDINQGILMRGYKMPPQRVLANQLGLNHGTVTRAYKICEEKGLVKGIVGKGTFIAASPGLPISLLTDHKDTDLISLGMAIPLYECNPLIETFVKQVRDSMDYGLTMRYCPPEGHIKHRYVAANWLIKYKINVKAENILITSGTQNALSIILMTLFEKGDRIVVDEYTYTGLISLASYMNVILVPVLGDEQGMDIEELKSACKREQPKGIYIMADYHNPTTVTLSSERRKALAKVIADNNLLLMEDATFSFSLEKKIKPVSAYIPEQSLFIMGTSKAISPAFRISYIAAPSSLVEKLSHGLNNIIWMASPYTSEIVSLLQSTGAYERIEAEKIRLLKERNQRFDDIMTGYDVLPAPTSCYRFLQLPGSYDDVELEYLALEKGVQILSANRFYVGSKTEKPTLRLAVSAPNTLEELEIALGIIKELLYNYPRRKSRCPVL
ncbi:PLP-dependent aminotransferase family protein [Desulfosporosinus sp. FKB]|uniref:aminotransferase-like domain-containing protein n=1 Tax=Desulfosporosinus sp. FKB TaxID=1969835 RepID=UPI000B49BC76|nr:PLP-dependent aminotransferase family protein [Desulfosporosinus sp. FKB]